MQPHTQIRSGATQLACLFAPRRFHKQAGAGENAALMRFENAAVDTATGAEIIAIDDQEFHDDTSLVAGRPSRINVASSATSNSSAPASMLDCSRPRRSHRASAV